MVSTFWPERLWSPASIEIPSTWVCGQGSLLCELPPGQVRRNVAHLLCGSPSPLSSSELYSSQVAAPFALALIFLDLGHPCSCPHTAVDALACLGSSSDGCPMTAHPVLLHHTDQAQNIRIGCSGAEAGLHVHVWCACFPYEIEWSFGALLAATGELLIPFWRSLHCLFVLGLLQLLFRPFARWRPVRDRALGATFLGAPKLLPRCLCSSVPSLKVFDWSPHLDRKGRWRRQKGTTQGSATQPCTSLALRCALALLGFANFPLCAWSSPPPDWHNAVASIEHAVTLFPEPVDAVGVEANRQRNTWGAVPSHPHSPCRNSCCVEERPSGTMMQCHFRVLCPLHRDEIVTLPLQIPGAVPLETLQHVGQSLVALQLAYANRVVATVPQLDAGHASVVLTGPWHEDFGDRVIILDFRAMGGPVYAKHVCVACSFYELSVEAVALGLQDWNAFLFGASAALLPGDRFRAVHGGVVQFCPVHQQPIWHELFEERMAASHRWGDPPQATVSPDLSYLLLSMERSRIYKGNLSGGMPSPQAIDEVLNITDASAICVPAQHGHMQNVALRGEWCCGVLAVDNTPASNPQPPSGFFVFLDTRQVGQEPTIARIRSNAVPLEHLANMAGVLRVPTGFHLSVTIAESTYSEGCIQVASGDTITFGFCCSINPLCGDACCAVGCGLDLSTRADALTEKRSRAAPCVRQTGTWNRAPKRRLDAEDHWGQPAGPSLASEAVPVGCSSIPPSLTPATAKLLEEPVSRNFADRDRVEHARDFVTGEGREWPFVPATDPLALQRAVNRDLSDSASEAMDDDSDFVFHVLTPGYTFEVVVSLAPPAEVATAIDKVQRARDPVHVRLFPMLSSATPQPAADHGVLIARPVWAAGDILLFFDLTDVDGRRFVVPGPSTASREVLLDIASIEDHDLVDIYVGSSPQPLGVIEDVAIEDCTSLFLVPRYFLPGLTFGCMRCSPHPCIGMLSRCCLLGPGKPCLCCGQ